MKPDATTSPGQDDAEFVRFRQLADALSLGLVIVREGRMVWASERLQALMGSREPAHLIGTTFRDWFKDIGRGVPESAGVDSLSCALNRANGETRTVTCRIAWRDEAADEQAWVIEDTTHVQVLEAELLRLSRRVHDDSREVASLRERLRRERSEREEILTVVSHELRTPVTIISGYNRLLLSEDVGPLTEDQRRFLVESTKGCRRLDAFIENLLEASRERGGDEVLEVCQGSLGAVIRGVAELLEPLLVEQDLRVAIDVDPDADAVEFDRQRVEQILTNLIGNAMKHSPPGGTIEISVQPLPQANATARRFVEVSVADDGPGVPEADRERIFEAYVQVGEQNRAGGLGLGLAVCRRLVEAHGGTIVVTERDGVACRFVFTLPAAGSA
jgi:signal transduction histidine kinase